MKITRPWPNTHDHAADTRPLQRHGTNQYNTCGYSGESTKRGMTADYLTSRIARDRPDILERMKAGEFSSVSEAARAAGIKQKSRQVTLAKDPDAAARRIREHFGEAYAAALGEALAKCQGVKS